MQLFRVYRTFLCLLISICSLYGFSPDRPLAIYSIHSELVRNLPSRPKFHWRYCTPFSSLLSASMCTPSSWTLILVFISFLFMPQCVPGCSRSFSANSHLMKHRKSCHTFQAIRQRCRGLRKEKGLDAQTAIIPALTTRKDRLQVRIYHFTGIFGIRLKNNYRRT